ncbi:hypothetical protein LAV77_02305 [Priestia megaterium]|uniref:hypothetical protein n=1 Tax=Priestia megaterium TaxID=1404 RepID=UPI002B250D8E|nr:hypothetical protein [Priestia megaterium]MEB2263617.1 hypothetical protein [Priestia megaterium]
MPKNYNVSVYEGNNFAYVAVADEAGVTIERVPNLYTDKDGEVTVKTNAVAIDPYADIKRKLIARIYSKKKTQVQIKEEYEKALAKALNK